MTKIQRRRYEKLCSFLETLPRKNFWFGSFIQKWDAKHPLPNSHPCGTVACALGYTPALFPRLVTTVTKHRDGVVLFPVLREQVDVNVGAQQALANEVFGVPLAVFCPHSQSVIHPRLPSLSQEATPKAVARMLRKYLKLRDAETR